MLKDHDYVDFADYRKDMDELGQQAANVAEFQAGKIRDLERLVNALVLAAGGEIAVSKFHLMHADDAEWERWYRAFDDTTVFTAKRKSPPSR